LYQIKSEANIKAYEKNKVTRYFSIRHRVQTGCGAHTASYPLVPGALTPGVKWPGHETGHSPSCSAEIKNTWRYTSTPPYLSMMW